LVIGVYIILMEKRSEPSKTNEFLMEK